MIKRLNRVEPIRRAIFWAGLLALEAALSVLSDRRGGGLSSQLLGGVGCLEINLGCGICMPTCDAKIAACPVIVFLESQFPDLLGLGPACLGLPPRAGRPGGSRLLDAGLPDPDNQVDSEGDNEEEEDGGGDDDDGGHDSLPGNHSLKVKGHFSPFRLTLSEKPVLI